MPSPCFASDENIQKAASLLKRGELVAFPTETVYGLGANALDGGACRRIFAAKNRPANNPLIVHISSVSYLTQVCDIEDPRLDENLLTKLYQFWPGPLSIVLPKHPDIPKEVTAGADTVAVRIPDHPVAKKLIELAGCPVAAPSANLSNSVSPTRAEHVAKGLGDKVSMILDGGPCKIGLESTVISLFEGKPKILRPGGVTREQLEQALEMKLLTAEPTPENNSVVESLPSPGMLQKHYSPNTTLEFRTYGHSHSNGRVGYIGFSLNPEDDFVDKCTVSRIISEDGNLEIVAQNLFASLQELDQMNLDRIVIDSCEQIGLGEAIMDRLNRAIS